ncbi:MAG: FtsX-like permease family protein, partial [Rhodoglobus sp.]
MTRRSRLSSAALAWRQFEASKGPSIALAVIVLLLVAVTASAPRALTLLYSAELTHEVGGLPSTTRDLRGETACPPITGDGASDLDPELAAIYGAMDGQLSHLRASLPQPLRSLVGEPRYLSTSGRATATDPAPARDAPLGQLVLAADPRVADSVRVVEGAAPAPFTGAFFDFKTGEHTTEAAQVMLSTTSAKRMDWQVGETRSIRFDNAFEFPVLLSGTFEAADPDSDYWKLNPSILDPLVFDDGNSTPIITGTGYLDPRSVAILTDYNIAHHTAIWLPFDVEGMTIDQAVVVSQQLRKLANTGTTIGAQSAQHCIATLTLHSEATPVIDRVVARVSSTNAVLALATAGPLGASLAVLALGARLITQRRKAGLALAAARGASGRQLRGIGAIEGLVIGVPAAMLGVAASVLIPAPFDPVSLLIPALVTLTPAVLLAGTSPGRRLVASRTDLGGPTGWRYRWILEVVVVALAALSVFLLLQRGLTVPDGSAAGDPLLAAAPVLLALATCVLVLRVYPLVLSALTQAMRRRRGLTGFLGSIRSVREPAAGLAPILALVVGVSVATFSVIMFATLNSGVDAAGNARVGADLQLTGTSFTDAQRREIAALDGVRTVAAIDDDGSVPLRNDKVRESVRLIVVDFAALRQLRPELPAGLDTKKNGAIPVVVSGDLAVAWASSKELTIAAAPLSVVASADPTTGLVADSGWVMVDKAFSSEIAAVDFRPRLLLVGLDPGASASTVVTGATSIGGSGTTSRTPADEIAEIRDTPTVTGLQVALLIATLLVGLLCAIAVILTSVVNAPARERLLALIETLGMSARQARSLATWELAPIAAVSLVAGLVLGLALPFIVLGSVDLRPFTTGAAQPAIDIPVLAILAVAVGFAVVVAAAVAIAVAFARRVNPAQTLRMGE